jgi:hypothetical protein
MKTFLRSLALLYVAVLVAACGQAPAWLPKGTDSTEATMDPFERSANEMRKKQDAAPPVVDPAPAAKQATVR